MKFIVRSNTYDADKRCDSPFVGAPLRAACPVQKSGSGCAKHFCTIIAQCVTWLATSFPAIVHQTNISEIIGF